MQVRKKVTSKLGLKWDLNLGLKSGLTFGKKFSAGSHYPKAKL